MHIPNELMNEFYDDRYFDVVNAIHEAKEVFFKGNEILLKLSVSKKLTVGETGFGSGRMLLAFLDFLSESNIDNTTIIWNSVELHPITPDRMKSILSCFQDSHSSLIEMLVDKYNSLSIVNPGWYSTLFHTQSGTLELRLRIGEALEMVQELIEPCDCWFLDGHGPRKNPMMWREELFNAIGSKTKSDGTFATYTVAGTVKRGLQAAGFDIEFAAGCGGKKQSLRGRKHAVYL